MSQISVIRFASTPYGTLGTMTLPDGQSFATMEPPWQNNAKGLSCVQAGRYALHEKASDLITRVTLGKFRHGLFLVAVPDRSAILIHPGNFATDSKGCILIGMAHASINNRPGVERSQLAFSKLMEYDRTHPLSDIAINWNRHGDALPLL